MYKPVQLITTITENEYSTIYLYEKSQNMIVPIIQENLNDNNCSALLVISIINSLEGKILGIKFYLCKEENSYVYLVIQKTKQIINLNIDTKTALDIYRLITCPIFIKEHIINSQGIYLTKEILEETISGLT